LSEVVHPTAVPASPRSHSRDTLGIPGEVFAMNIALGLRAALVVGCLVPTSNGYAANLPPVSRPEEAGMSSARLALIGTRFSEDTAQDKLPGAVIAIARHGKLVYFEAFGWRDKTKTARMTTDTVFNIASMTKPVTTVGGLILSERGVLPLGDPLSKHMPQLANKQVAVLDATAENVVSTVPAMRPVTIRHLMTHTSGFVYGRSPAAAKLLPDGTSEAVQTLTRDEFIALLAKTPLLYQPGTVWEYSFGHDLLGFTIEAVTKQKLSDYMKENLFTPLGMSETGFGVRPDLLPRYAWTDRDLDDKAAGRLTQGTTKPFNFECGAGCLRTTAGDYMRFAMMLANKGELDGTRILGRKTVEYMGSNQLGPEVKNQVAAVSSLYAGYDFGLGVAVRRSDGSGTTPGSAGDFSWPGAHGTFWWVDPKEEMAVVFMAYPPAPVRNYYREVITALVYQAIVE
jgi:CubicO group peptidase (beta-lactamase class C family)